MLLSKEKDAAAKKKLQKKIPMVSNVYISPCLACKIPCGILRGCPRKNGQNNFSTFADFLIFVQFWLFWFYLRALKGISMTQCARTFLWITCSMDCSLVLEKEKFNRNCIDAVYSRTSRSLILTTIMWLVLCALNIIDMTLNWRHIKAMILTYNYLEHLANGKPNVRINGTNSALLIVTQWVAKGSILGPLLYLTFINHLPSAMLISSLIIPSFRLVSTFPWKHKHFNLPSTEHWQSTRNHIGD